MAGYEHGQPKFAQYEPYDPVAQNFESEDYLIRPPLPPPKSEVRDKYTSPWNKDSTPWDKNKSTAPWVQEHQTTSNAGSFDNGKDSKSQAPPDDLQEDVPTYGSHMTILRRLGHVVRYIFIVALVGIPLLVPVILFQDDATVLLDTDDPQQIAARNHNNQLFYVFLWLETTWLAAVVSNLIALALPYIFFFVSRYVNASHRRYWRMFRTLKWPITFTGTLFAAFLSFGIWVHDNPLVVSEQGVTEWDWTDTFNDILQMGCYWVALYIIEKIGIMYICIHFHYRADFHRLQRSKQLQVALCSLYEASTSLYQPYDEELMTEDLIIHDSAYSGKGNKRKEAGKFLQKIGGGMATFISLFGTSVGASNDSHWLKASSSYATVEHALEHPKSAAALAKRIWMSLVSQGRDALTVEDIAEAFGPHRRTEAKACFETLDENENGDIRLNELVPTVVEAGRVRMAIYEGMHDIDHVINTVGWILLMSIAAVIIFFILVSYDPTTKSIQQTIGVIFVGLAFAIGRTIHEFVLGVIFILFKHPFDVGDRVDVFNTTELASVSVVVKRISLLYVVFRRVDDGKDVQFPNSRLTEKRIENLTRSGLNQQQISLYIDFATPFKDIQLLRTELEGFMSQKENARDFKPDLNLRVVSIHDMSKLELKCTIVHKSNWSNDRLKGLRSSRFMCALIAATKKVPILKLNGSIVPSGNESNPSYSVMVTEDEAAKKRDADKSERQKKRIDWKEVPATKTDGNNKTAPEITVHELSPEEIAEDEAKQRKKEEEAAEKVRKEEQEKREEEAARDILMEVPIPLESAARDRSASLAAGAESERSPFSFISMSERGIRRSPRTEFPEIRGPFYQ